jgi:hydrogenase-4 membrane subunit HyfE
MMAVPFVNQSLEPVDMLTIVMVLVAVGISAAGAIRQMIQLYQLQSIVLVLITGLAASKFYQDREQGTALALTVFALLIPATLAYIIQPMLAQATVPGGLPWPQRLLQPLTRLWLPAQRRAAQQSVDRALIVWLEQNLSPQRQAVSLVAGMLLVAIALAVASSLRDVLGARFWSVAAALALLQIGIFTMINRQDLISQIIGLLVMDHGLFLAVVRGVSYASLVPLLVLALSLYILITLVILVILLPELHSKSRSMQVADQSQLKG